MTASAIEINRLWNYKQLAHFLGISESNAKRLRVPHVKIGRSIRFRPEIVLEWLSHRETSRSLGRVNA
jgi:predicted DNA-binding transcriptional regulator AlpA